MSARKTYHVLSIDGDWKVKLENAQRASAVFDTKAQAIERARELAKAAPLGQVKVHREGDDVIQKEWTYGKDPEKYLG
jgi:uncharacterized protein YdaT